MCVATANVCVLDTKCANVNKKDFEMKLTLTSANVDLEYRIDGEDILRQLYDSKNRERNQCRILVYQSLKGKDDVWYLGNVFMRNYYVVYDMSPLDERGEDYI